jgi:OTU domain-containing protein 6
MVCPAAQALKRQICVVARSMPTVTLGEEFGGKPAAPPPLTLCYMRHAFGLGEHYNSTEPAGEEAERVDG